MPTWSPSWSGGGFSASGRPGCATSTRAPGARTCTEPAPRPSRSTRARARPGAEAATREQPSRPSPGRTLLGKEMLDRSVFHRHSTPSEQDPHPNRLDHEIDLPPSARVAPLPSSGRVEMARPGPIPHRADSHRTGFGQDIGGVRTGPAGALFVRGSGPVGMWPTGQGGQE